MIKQNFKKTNAIWYVEKSDIETGSIDRVLNKEHSYGKSIRKMCIDILEKNYQKPKKINLKKLQKTKGDWN